jgi:thermitase
MNKYGLIISSVICGFCISAKADRIYQISNEQKSDTRVQSALMQAGIVDTIPQINVVITKNLVSERDIKDLGNVGTITLPETRVVANPGKIPLYGMQVLDVETAWLTTKGEGVLVAVSDTGIDSKHPDLAENIWNNPGETGVDANGADKATNKVDDDGNGYVDDVHGWNFVKKTGSGKDNHYHGTHVAGTIAAKTGLKITGVAPKATLMDVSFISSSGSGEDANGAKSLIYAADNGAKVINCSWGGPGTSEIIDEAIKYAMAKGVLVVVAAGNNGSNNDRTKFFPATSDIANIISVAASDSSNNKASFSNFGPASVELAAPGVYIKSTAPSNGKKASYQYLDGTSMASPHVTGVAALAWAAHPKWTWEQVREAVVASAVPNKHWDKKTITGGIVNAANAVQ